jgi:hypothetical protein
LITVPSIYPYHARPGAGGYPDYWRFFEDSLRMMLADFSSVLVARDGGPATAMVLFMPFLNRHGRFLRTLAERADALVERMRPHNNATVLVAWARR